MNKKRENGIIEKSIIVKNLSKYFYSTRPYKGNLLKKFKNYILPKYETKIAVNNISFEIKSGERVAFIGPNGAGKSTTIKMLAGITKQNEGSIKILGKNPSKNRSFISYKIGVLFGQTSQLWQELPIIDSFKLLSAIYNISKIEFQERLNRLSKLFKIDDYIYKNANELSLGERMRCEIVACLLHNPSVIFFDEPTIGLDITSKAIIRDLIKELAEKENKTLLLTSHDTDDIEKVCNRVIIMNEGKIVFDDTLNSLKAKYVKKKLITIISEEPEISFKEKGTNIIKVIPHKTQIEIDLTLTTINKVISFIISKFNIKDLTIENPPLEDIIEDFYKK
ncbi:MAG: ATP-binding cassette domain-containing protein [Bacteroidetes bacterium]|nr:ATP-binding cassette domain-containing protein [Bacteroidota bacterium]